MCGWNFTISNDMIVGGECYQQKSICQQIAHATRLMITSLI